MVQGELAEALKALDSGLAAAEAERRACADERKLAELPNVTGLADMQLQPAPAAGWGMVQPGALNAGGILAVLGLSTASTSADDQAMADHFATRLSSFLVSGQTLPAFHTATCKTFAVV